MTTTEGHYLLRDLADALGRTDSPSADAIVAEIARIGLLLLEKNAAYGDSAFEPLAIFGMRDPALGLRVRIDDKLKRISMGGDDTEDTVADLIGYLVLLRIVEAK